MPVYEYICIKCEKRFAHLWKTISQASDNPPPDCPECGAAEPTRIISQTAVLKQMGGLTPGETEQVKATEERMASITPKSQIDHLQANRAASQSS